jgi:hypothetical protein
MSKKVPKKKDELTVQTNVRDGENYKEAQKLRNKEYESELFKLQLELVKLQDWVKKTRARIAIVFEGGCRRQGRHYQTHYGASEARACFIWLRCPHVGCLLELFIRGECSSRCALAKRINTGGCAIRTSQGTYFAIRRANH